uniref:Protein E6 n=1 Tax=Bat papillomavirus TaxID=2004707 RepID=A0A2Z2JN86_9PAPI|nr:E6 [Bat papillomavirus]
MERPLTLRDLASSRDTSVDDLQIQCRFCDRRLGLYEKLVFEQCQLRVIYRLGRAYAACPSCVKIVSRIEFAVGVEACFAAGYIESLQGETLFEVDLRCVSCLKPLDRYERAFCYHTNSLIYVVRGRHRALCYLCHLF